MSKHKSEDYKISAETNAIEMWFNQIKHTLKLNKKVLKFNELKLKLKFFLRKKVTTYTNKFYSFYNNF